MKHQVEDTQEFYLVGCRFQWLYLSKDPNGSGFVVTSNIDNAYTFNSLDDAIKLGFNGSKTPCDIEYAAVMRYQIEDIRVNIP